MSQLYNNLQYVNASRENRSRVTNEVLNSKDLFPQLLKICFMVNDKTSIKACWVLEFVCKEKLNWLLPYLDEFTNELSNVKFDSSIRPIAKICEFLCTAYFKNKDSKVQKNLNAKHLEKITEACFDWLINDEKVAVKAYSMNSLFLIGKKIEWIHPELRKVLASGFANHTAAYKARARHILDKLK